jgi:hypothetical protein
MSEDVQVQCDAMLLKILEYGLALSFYTRRLWLSIDELLLDIHD